MKVASLFQNLEFKPGKPSISVLLESDFTKEIRILLAQDQVMQEHRTPFPIVIEIVEGEINFGLSGEVHQLRKGDLISLGGGIPHDLKALSNSIVRLTLSKTDQLERVKKVAEG